jgi:hypothetical protein
LLQLLALAERSGTITVTANGRTSRVAVESDRVIGWGLDQHDPRELVVACDLLSPRTRKSIDRITPRSDTPGLSFIVRNLVEPRRWDAIANRQLEQEVYPFLGAEDGTFEVEVMPGPPAPFRYSRTVNSVVLDSSRWESEMEAARLDGYRLGSMWRRGQTLPTEELRISSVEWMVWARMTEPLSLADIAARLAISDLATIGAIRRLRVYGMVEPADE